MLVMEPHRYYYVVLGYVARLIGVVAAVVQRELSYINIYMCVGVNILQARAAICIASFLRLTEQLVRNCTSFKDSIWVRVSWALLLNTTLAMFSDFHRNTKENSENDETAASTAASTAPAKWPSSVDTV